MNSSSEKNSSLMTPAKRNIRILIDKRNATKIRLEKELSRPKILIEEYQETPKPSSYYLKIAKQRYISLKASKSSQQIMPRSSKANSNPPRIRQGLKFPEPVFQEKPKVEQIPSWLQARLDFQESIRNSELVRNKRVPLVLELEYHNRSAEDNEMLRGFLRGVKFFERLPSQVIVDVSNRLLKEMYSENDFIARTGDLVDSLIVIYEGTARVVVDGIVVAEKGPKEAIGDVTLDNRMQIGDIIASSECIVFKLMREDFEAAVLHTRKLEKKENLEFLAGLPIFSGWNRLKLNRLSSVFHTRFFDRNFVLYKRDDPSASIFFIKQGKVNIYAYVPLEKSNIWPVSANKWTIRQVNKEYLVKVAKIRAGQYFGEAELVSAQARTMKAVTLKETILLELNKDQFFEFFYGKYLDLLMRYSLTVYLDVKTLKNKLISEIYSKKNSENALLSALKVDFSSLHGRDSLLDPKIKKLNNWLSSYRNRRAVSTKTLKGKIISGNSRDISIDKIRELR